MTPEKPTYEELEQRVRELEYAESIRKRTEAASGHTSDLLSLFLKHSPIYAFLKEVSTSASKVLYVSDNYIDMVGVPSSRMIGKTMHELFPHELAEKITRDDIDVVSRGGGLKFDEELDGRRYITYKFPIDCGDKKYLAGYTIDITDRKRAEEDFIQIFTMSLDMLCIADINTSTFIKVNPAFTEVLGYSEEALLEKSFLDFIHPEDIEATRTIVEKRLKAGTKVINFENRYRCKDGSYRWLSWVSHPNPEKGLTFAVARDITEMKLNQEALQKSKSLLDATGRMAKVGGWELDPGTSEVAWTEEIYRIHEVPPDYKPTLQEAIDFFHPEDRPQLERAIQRAVDHGEPYDLEVRFITARGTNLWTRTICRPEIADGKTVKLKGTFQDITYRKKAENALIESEARYRSVLDTINEGVILQAASGEILTWNKGAEDIFGILAKDVIGSISEGKDWPAIQADGSKYSAQNHPSMNTLRTGKPCRNEIMGVYQPSGALRWISINTNPLFQDNGKKPYAVAISFSDITELKRIEDNLRKSEKELQRTLDATADGIWSWNFKANELYFSPQYYKMLGYTPNEFEANFENWLNLIHPDDRDRALDVADKFLKMKPDVYENEFRLKTKSGEYRWTRTVGKVVERDENGDAVYMIGNHEDTTERKLALDAFMEERERFELAMRSVNDGLWDWNLKTNEIYYSPVWKKLLGYEDHEIKNEFSEWERLTNPEDVKESRRILNEVLEGKRKGFENEFKMLHKDGRWVNILARANVILDETGKATRVIGTHVDITERKRLEKQLQQSQKMEAVGTLAGGIAHDFNNMLGIIIGNISYVLSSLQQGDELYEVLGDVQTASKQAQGLTHQLLTFSKGGAPIKKAADINKIIREAATFSTRGANSTCNFELSNDLWSSEVDEGQINQVINNLMINANQAMPNGGTITIRTENVNIDAESGIPLPSGQYIKILVEDQGVGVSEKHLSNIFEPYFTTKQKGGGLGLATTYSIIKKHDGHITVYSEIEKGTVFSIYLPASLKCVNEDRHKAEPDHKGQGKILVMDDQKPILKMVGRMLNRMGYENACATDGSQAIEMYKEAQSAGKPFDAVVLDLTVPGGMGGLKTIIELLKIDPDIKAVVSSGYSNDPVMSNYEDYGFCAIVSKPYTKAQLAEVLNKLFGEYESSFRAGS